MRKTFGALSIALGLFASPALSQGLLSDKELARLGDETYGTILKELPLVTSGNEFQIAKCLFKALTSDASLAPEAKAWTLTVIDRPGDNAAALPGGHILLYRGMLEAPINHDTLAFVLATQISTAQLGLPGRQTALGQLVVKDGQVQLERHDLVSEIAAADRQAVRLTSQAGFDPVPGIDYLEQTKNSYRTSIGIQQLRELVASDSIEPKTTTCP